MKILFLSLMFIENIKSPGIYSDLLNKFYEEGNDIFVVSPTERRRGKSTSCSIKDGVHYLNVWTFNNQKANVIEKGISTLLIERQYKKAICKFFKGIKFDIVLYPTPPITFANVVKFIKNRDDAFTYLLLKDIFPQNAVDLNMISENGILHKYFRHKEKQLYNISDVIGCMSDANVQYLLFHNPQISNDKVEVCPNSISVKESISVDNDHIVETRKKYNIDTDKFVCIYGGNLGLPQDIPYIIECLNFMSDDKEFQFIIVGSGTEYPKLAKYIESANPKNVRLFSHMPQEEYNEVVRACDAGLIFLDHRFSIPNYPSRLLSYLSAGLPVLASTDKNTDIGTFLESNEIGVWCESVNPLNFKNALNCLRQMKIGKEKVFQVLKSSYDVSVSYNTIVKHFS